MYHRCHYVSLFLQKPVWSKQLVRFLCFVVSFQRWPWLGPPLQWFVSSTALCVFVLQHRDDKAIPYLHTFIWTLWIDTWYCYRLLKNAREQTLPAFEPRRSSLVEAHYFVCRFGVPFPLCSVLYEFHTPLISYAAGCRSSDHFLPVDLWASLVCPGCHTLLPFSALNLWRDVNVHDTSLMCFGKRGGAGRRMGTRLVGLSEAFAPDCLKPFWNLGGVLSVLEINGVRVRNSL